MCSNCSKNKDNEECHCQHDCQCKEKEPEISQVVLKPVPTSPYQRKISHTDFYHEAVGMGIFIGVIPKDSPLAKGLAND